MSERTAILLGFAACCVVTLAVTIGLRLLGANGQLFGLVVVMLLGAGAVSLSKITTHYHPGKRG